MEDLSILRAKFKSIIRKINGKSRLSSSYQIEAVPIRFGRTHMDIDDIEEGDPDLEED
jgi:hypothetical protein